MGGLGDRARGQVRPLLAFVVGLSLGLLLMAAAARRTAEVRDDAAVRRSFEWQGAAERWQVAAETWRFNALRCIEARRAARRDPRAPDFKSFDLQGP